MIIQKNFSYILLESNWSTYFFLILGYLAIVALHVFFIVINIRLIKKLLKRVKEKLKGIYISSNEVDLGLIDNHTASILCYLTIIGWLIAFLFCENKESISQHLTRGLRNAILLMIPACFIPQVISIIISIINIRKIVKFDECEYVIWDWYDNYYSQPGRMILVPIGFIFIIIILIVAFTILFFNILIGI